MLQRVLQDAGLDYADLDRIATTTGPGSFTGVRVGLAAARGIALGRGKPAVGITTLEALAATAVRDLGLPPGGRLAVAVDARRGELYIQTFDVTDKHPVPASPAEVAGLGDIGARLAAPLTVVGSGAAIAKSILGDGPGLSYAEEPRRADPAVIAALAAERAVEADQPPPSPLYLRAPDAKLPGGIEPPAPATSAAGRP